MIILGGLIATLEDEQPICDYSNLLQKNLYLLFKTSLVFRFHATHRKHDRRPLKASQSDGERG